MRTQLKPWLRGRERDANWCDCNGCTACNAGDHHHCEEQGGEPCGLVIGHMSVSLAAEHDLTDEEHRLIETIHPTGNRDALDPYERSRVRIAEKKLRWASRMP